MYQTSLQLPDHQQELVRGVWLQADAVLKPVLSWLLQLQKTFDRCGNIASVFHSCVYLPECTSSEQPSLLRKNLLEPVL